MLRFFLSFLGAIFSLVTIGAVLAALVVGAIFWMYSRDLPDHEQLASYAPATISRVYSGEGRVIDEFARERRLFTPIDEIPDTIKHAFVSAEDKNFYTHKGYDPLGIVKAAIDAAQGERLRGASTITQQVMKNFLLSGDRSGERKIKELILASRLENTLSKDQILELYLNEIFLGQNSYGVTAAALTYFGKPLEEVTPAEAAYLAALPKAPSDYHPVRQAERATARRNFVLKEMAENGYLTSQVADAAQNEVLASVQNGDFISPATLRPPRDYFTDEIRRQLSGTFGEQEFFGGGLSIRATIDPELQKEAAKALRRQLEKYDRGIGLYRGEAAKIDPALLETEESWREALADTVVARDIEGWHPAVVLKLGKKSVRVGIESVEEDDDGHYIPMSDLHWRPRLENGGRGNKARTPGDLMDVGDVIYVRAVTKNGAFVRWSLRQIPEVQGGFMAMDTNTGRVISMQGGFSYQHSVYNRATQATRQPGSSFKPFVYAAALDSGYSPVSVVVDAPITVRTPQGLWRPRNSSNRFYGPAPIRVGVEQSRNLMTIRLAKDVGMNVVADYAERFGVYDDMGEYLANSLGSQETTLLKMVSAYAMFANGGERVEPTLVDRVQDRFGATVYRHDQRVCDGCKLASLQPGRSPSITSNRERVLDPVTAYQLTSMMRGVVQRGTAKGYVNLGVPVAGKTGTTNDAKDVWFIGFTRNIVAGCYIGHDQPRSLGRKVYGANMCGPVFTNFMRKAIAKYGAGKFQVPGNTRFLKFDRFTGARLPNDARGNHVVAELFRIGEEPGYGVAGLGGGVIDGGFAMGQDLKIINRSGTAPSRAQTVQTSTGKTAKIPKKATIGSMSTGGLY